MNELVLKGFILVEYNSDKIDETAVVTRRSCEKLGRISFAQQCSHLKISCITLKVSNNGVLFLILLIS